MALFKNLDPISSHYFIIFLLDFVWTHFSFRFLYYFVFFFQKQSPEGDTQHSFNEGKAKMTTKTLLVLCLSAIFVATTTANGIFAQTDGHADAPARCDLVCSNGGYCTLREGEPDELAKSAQSGKLIEVCVCQPGFTGVACESVVKQCSNEARTCHNGLPCELDPLDGEWKCDCSDADSLSSFAGKMCRNPATEYCSGRFRPDSDLSFCTNGGRCKADFIAAQIAPGDTSVNRAYQ